MSEEHNADDGTDSVNRRRFVKALGTVGGAAAFGTFSTGTVKASSTERSVERLSGKRERKVTQRVKEDKKVATIFQFLSKEGWEPQYEDGKYGLVTTTNGESFNIAAVPLQPPNKSENRSGALRWSEKSDEQTGVTTLNQESEVGDHKADFEERAVWIENGDIKSDTKTYSTTTSSDGKVGTNTRIAPPGAYGSCEEFVRSHCTNWNISCIAWTLAALGISCNPWTGWVTCAAGNIVAWGPHVTGDGCSFCDNYNVHRIYVGRACS